MYGRPPKDGNRRGSAEGVCEAVFEEVLNAKMQCHARCRCDVDGRVTPAFRALVLRTRGIHELRDADAMRCDAMRCDAMLCYATRASFTMIGTVHASTYMYLHICLPRYSSFDPTDGADEHRHVEEPTSYLRSGQRKAGLGRPLVTWCICTYIL